MVVYAKPRLLSEQPKPTAQVQTDDEEALIRLLLCGDPRAGDQLYDHLIRVVEWTLLRIIGQRLADHDDLVQSAFEQVVKTIQSGTYSRSCALTTWASAITSHLALNALRARRRDRRFLVSVDAAPGVPSSLDVEAQVIARRRLQLARLELSKMNPQRAQAVILHDVSGLSLPEVAAALGVSVAAAQSRLSRGRRELSERVGKFDDETPPSLSEQPEESI